MNISVAIRKIDDYQLNPILDAVEEFLNTNMSHSLARAKTVLIKPNLLGAFTPEQAVTTHPVVLEAVVLSLLKMGKEIWMGDSPGGTVNVKQVWQTCGLIDLADRYPIKLVNFSSFGVKEIQVESIKLQISKVVWNVDVIINISKYKTHSLMAFTGAVKNLYGLVPGLIKTVYHREHPDTDSFAHLLAVLHQQVKHKVVYHLMDGIVGMDGAGPSAGSPKRFGLLFGSVSAPALDFIAASLMGFKLSQVPYLKEILHAEGILPSRISYPISFRNFRLTGIDLQTVGLRSQVLKYLPPIVKLMFKKLFDFYPYITSECKNCKLCVRSCPMQTIKDSVNSNPIIVIQNCIKCMCCHEMCPHHAILLKKSWLASKFLKN